MWDFCGRCPFVWVNLCKKLKSNLVTWCLAIQIPFLFFFFFLIISETSPRTTGSSERQWVRDCKGIIWCCSLESMVSHLARILTLSVLGPSRGLVRSPGLLSPRRHLQGWGSSSPPHSERLSRVTAQHHGHPPARASPQRVLGPGRGAVPNSPGRRQLSVAGHRGIKACRKREHLRLLFCFVAWSG